MTAVETFEEAGQPVSQLLDQARLLRSGVLADAAPFLGRFGPAAASPAIADLAHYLAIRHRDLRPLQRQLMWHGLSSLGRMESRVLPTLDAVIAVPSALTGEASDVAPAQETFFAGEARLQRASDRLFGAPPNHRRSRIMVTLPTEAASDDAFVADLLRRGMDIARINCAHDDRDVWRAMTERVRAAGAAVGRAPTVLMDVGGPKIRTEAVAPGKPAPKLQAGARFRLIASGGLTVSPEVPWAAAASLPEMVTSLKVGDRVLYDDGKLSGRVERTGAGEAVIMVERTKAGGVRLKPQKGLNFPDTALGLSPLTAKDENDLAAVIGCADMIGYSFVSRPDDIDRLEAAIGKAGQRDWRLGLIAEIERPEAVTNLPDLIARAAGKRPLGVMIARGDLAAEIGFERLAEMQEEILWVVRGRQRSGGLGHRRARRPRPARDALARRDDRRGDGGRGPNA